ncbi:MAG TPA: hypothetical protein VNV86_04660 [Candidatus Acidoferrum sp.]|nr:hypothetical protein [Candidatus Acidoferrum sp.]
MDLRLYYQKMREIETAITEEFPVIVSNDTGDGGKAGTVTEVTRRLAAKMVVEGQARLATADETAAYRESQAELRRSIEQSTAAGRLQISVLSTRELEQLKADARKQTKG